MPGDDKLPRPEEQFCSVLRARWQEEGDAYRATEERANLKKSDYTLLVTLVPRNQETVVKKFMWRRIALSGGLTLRAVADKILLPALGFIRNYHSFMFVAYSYGCA
jgi:hypothetical protein